jgi:hypothetical protein
MTLKIPLLATGKDLSKEEAIENYIRNMTTMVYDIASSSESGFYTSSSQVITNAFNIGIGIRYITVPNYNGESIGLSACGNNNSIKFASVDPREFVFDIDGYGNINFAARELYLTLEQSESIWGEAATVAANMSGITRNRKYNQVKKYYHVVIANPFLLTNEDEAKYLEIAIDGDSRKIVACGTLRQMPYIVWRFFQETGELYGRSPLYYLTKEIMAADKYVQAIRIAAEFAINPPWIVKNDETFRKKDFLPGALMVGGLDPMGEANIQKVPVGEGLQIAQQLLELKKSEIVEGLIIRDLSQQYNQPGMTETLVAEQKLAQDNRIKPIITRWEREDLGPLVKYILRYLTDGNDKFKMLSFPYFETSIDPNEMRNPVDALDIRYGGLLGRQQDQYENYKINVFLGEISQMAQLSPSIINTINYKKIIEAKNKINAFEYDILLSEEEQQQLRKNQEMMMEQQQKEQNAQMMKMNMENR